MDSNFVSQLNPPDVDQLMNGPFRELKVTSNLCYENNGALVRAVAGCLEDKASGVLLDLSEVRLADSSGVRSLLRARKLCEEAGAELRIGAVSDCVRRVLSMSGLSSTFGLPDLHWQSSSATGAQRRDLSQAKWQIHEHIAANDAYMIAVLRDKATETAIQAGASGDMLCDIQIAAGEALTNAYKHGNECLPDRKITMRCMSCEHAVAIEVEDEGRPFDADAIPPPDPDRPHGMGVFLMRQAMDRVEFAHNCPGNKVRMIKWLKPRN